MVRKPQKTTRASAGKVAGKSRLNRNDDLMFYTGTTPFIWSVDIFLQGTVSGKWFVTLHLTAQGSSTQVFRSETVEIFMNDICAVPFLADAPVPFKPNDYVMSNCEMEKITKSYDNDVAVNVVYVKMTSPIRLGAPPRIEIINTEINPTWLIGAREIILTDPPIMQDVPTRSADPFEAWSQYSE